MNMGLLFGSQNQYSNFRKTWMNMFETENGDAQVMDADTAEKGIELPTQEQLPAIITAQFDKLEILENNVAKSVNLAHKAREKASNAQVSAGWFQKKNAIELLQDAAQGLAKAQISLADAQKISFEYQTKLTEITKFLFGLGISNIAMNRSVVRELELKLKGASDEEISDLARQELKNVILQLKAQEDMMQKQEFLTGKVKEQAGQLKDIDKQLDDIEEADEEQDERIAENAERITKHSKVLSAQQQKDKEHDERISENAQDIDYLEKQDEEQDKLIAVGIKKDKEHDEKISESAQKIDELERQDQEQDKIIADIVVKINEHDRTLNKHSKQDTELAQKIQEVSQNTAEMIAGLKESISENAVIANKNISLIENKLEKQIGIINEVIQTSNEDFEQKLANCSTALKNDISELKKELGNQTKDINIKIENLENRINIIDAAVSKKAWKIAVSVVAGASLLLNLLQIIGII